MSIAMRYWILDQVVQEAKKKGDERWKDIWPQREELRLALEKQQKPTPEPVVVKLKTARAGARAKM